MGENEALAKAQTQTEQLQASSLEKNSEIQNEMAALSKALEEEQRLRQQACDEKTQAQFDIKKLESCVAELKSESSSLRQDSCEGVANLESMVTELKAERSRQEANENGERQQMVAILNEKSRENSKLKKGIGQLLEQVAVEERNHEDQISSISKEKLEKEELSKATVQNCR